MGFVTTAVVGCEVHRRPRRRRPAAKRREIDTGVDSTLAAALRGRTPAPGSSPQKAEGILVFPSVTKAGLVVGGEYGEGALRIRNQTVGYYSATAGSIG